MVDFIRMGLQELRGSLVECELQNVKFLPTVGFEPGTFCLRSEHANTEQRRVLSDLWFKVCRVFPGCFIFRKVSVARGRYSKFICRELHFVNCLQSANFLIGQTEKYFMTKSTRQIILLHLLPVLQVNF